MCHAQYPYPYLRGQGHTLMLTLSGGGYMSCPVLNILIHQGIFKILNTNVYNKLIRRHIMYVIQTPTSKVKVTLGGESLTWSIIFCVGSWLFHRSRDFEITWLAHMLIIGRRVMRCNTAIWGPTPKCVKLHTALWGPTHFGVKIKKLTPKCVNVLHINALWVQEV
jgi:hypothetical protein